MKKISESNKLLLLSLAVGILTGLAAVVLLELIEVIQAGLRPFLSGDGFSWWLLALPGIGMLLALLLVRYVIKDNIGHGVTKVLQAMSRNESQIKPHNTFSSVITSALTIGFGGSVGAEAPIVYTGAAIGSNIGRLGGLSYRSVTTLVGCGAAGAIAGIFKAPLAGMLFTMEILFFNISLGSLMPLLLSTMSATVVAYLFRGLGPSFACALEPLSMANIPFYVVLGLFCGFVSLYFTRSTLALEDRFAKMRSPWLRWLLCSLCLGLLIFLFPPLYGEGYTSVTSLLTAGSAALPGTGSPLSALLDSNWGVVLFFALVMLLKVVSMTMTNAGGGVGGTFGPTLVVGALAGFVFVRMADLCFTGRTFPEQNFVLVGMAGLMAGVMQAPMTAIFLIAEITGGYDLLLPLIIVATCSFGCTRIWERYSIYTKRIAQNGELLTHDNDQAVLTLLHTRNLIRDKYPRLSLNASLGEIMPIVSESTAAVFPVLDENGKFQGLIDMDDLRKHMFRTDEYSSVFVYNLMKQPLAYIAEDEPVGSVLDKFEKTDAWRLPVLDEEGNYLGFISKSRILMAYRDELKAISVED